nr:hypothetical protein [Tanacetum cinerariifolium]
MSRDVLTVSSTMRILLLHRGEYSQWVERFMNYLEEQTDGEAMINSIKDDKSMWSDQEKRIQKIDHLARSLLIQGLSNDIYSLIDINKTAKDLWDALARHISKENVVVSSNFEGSEVDDFSELKKITALLAKAFNRRKFYSKPTNNNLRTSSSSQSANKKQEFVKTDNKKDEKKDDEKKKDMSRVKCYNSKKEGHFSKDYKKAKVKDYDDSDHEINANMVFMAQIKKVLSYSEASSSSADEKISENRVEKANQQSKDFENQNKDLQDKYDVLKNQTTTFEMNNKELNEQLKELIETNNDLLAQTKEKYAKLEAERYEYMIRYSAYFDNDKQHRKQIADQQVLYDKMSVQLVELDKHVRDLKNTVLEEDFKISKLEECVWNKDLEIEKCLERLNVYENKLHKMGQTNQTVHMIMPSKDNLYNGRKGIGFENPRYFEKAKDLRPTIYDENVIGLGYTLMFLTHSNEALEIEKFKRSRENKIKFAYDYDNLNASYVNEKINLEDDYFQEKRV